MAERTAAEVGAEVRTLLDELAGWPDAAGFTELLALNEQLGLALGAAARTQAVEGSWSQVASWAGMSKQAAWSRWH